MSPDVLRARRLIEARLGRPPQDALEAAVVLEAWAGVPAQQALETARALMPVRPAAALVSRAAPQSATPSRESRAILEGLAFVVAIMAIALWASPLADALGAGVVRDALVLALPLTLALQWALACRHLGRPSGPAGLAARRGALLAAAFALVLGAGALLGQAGTLAGLLVVTWTAGTILIHRGWSGAYCAIVVGGTSVLLAGVPAPEVVAGVAATTAGLAWFALRTMQPAGAAIPGRWSRTAGAAATGAALGVLLVADPTVSWTGTAAPALALLPSALGALWAGRHLWQLAGSFPRALAGAPARRRRGAAARAESPSGAAEQGTAARGAAMRGDSSRPHGDGPSAPARGRAASRVMDFFASGKGSHHSSSLGAASLLRGAAFGPARALGGAVARLVAATVAGSAVLVAVAPWGQDAIGVFAGFGVVALAMLLAGLLDALGRPALAAAGAGGGVVTALLVDPWFAGAGLLCGGVVAVLVLAPATLILVTRPARTLATTLWIT